MTRPGKTGPIIATLPTLVPAALTMKPDDALLARLDPDIAPRVLRLVEAEMWNRDPFGFTGSAFATGGWSLGFTGSAFATGG